MVTLHATLRCGAHADPAEYKFAGGGVDENETLLSAARRELSEEFLTAVPESAELFLFNVTQTKPVQGRSYSMYNFVCMAEENSWLAELDCDAINATLQARRDRFSELTRAGEFWEMAKPEREEVAPEVHAVQWLDLADAVHMCMNSKVVELAPVNEYQAVELQRHGVTERDPMFVTMATRES